MEHNKKKRRIIVVEYRIARSPIAQQLTLSGNGPTMYNKLFNKSNLKLSVCSYLSSTWRGEQTDLNLMQNKHRTQCTITIIIGNKHR